MSEDERGARTDLYNLILEEEKKKKKTEFLSEHEFLSNATLL